jgi:predicted Zn-dependent protease
MAHVIKKHASNRLLTEYSINTISRLVKATGLLQTAAKELTRKFLISHYSRENEFEADEFGVRLMKAAGYQARGASEFCEWLEKLNSDKTNYPEYFSSHPNTKSRLENIREYL